MDQPSEHDAPPPSPQSSADEALRGTRFEFGGRRPYSFAPPRVVERAAGPGRPLPGIGTVALGQVSRIVPYGAFVDFLGFRGMIHVSQLRPGQRVERVEDVLQLQDQVQVRVIGVDPERRHINLVLVTKVDAAPGEEVIGAPSADAPSADAPSADAPSADAPLEAPGAAAASSTGAPETAEIAVEATVAEPFVGQPREPRRLTPAATAKPAPAAQRSVARPSRMPAAKPAARVEPKPLPAVAQHGARAIRRELADPRHPMARLLASAGQSSTRPAEKERASLEAELPPLGRPAPVAPEPPRPVHVFGPDPEPEEDQPATLEALAARFGQRATAKPSKTTTPTTAADRSRQQREKQAQILAKLREDAAKFTK